MTLTRGDAVILGTIAGIAIGVVFMMLLVLVDGCYRPPLPPEPPTIVEVTSCSEGGPR